MYVDSKGNRWYKGNLHTHTTLSDGVKSPEETKRVYKYMGYDFIVLSDHWYYGEGVESDPSGLLVLSGAEYNFNGEDSLKGVFHIVGFGTERDPEVTREDDAQAAIDAKIPAATIVTDHAEDYDTDSEINEIKIAFDGDAVLFSDESEAIYKQYGLDAFAEHERKLAEQPMEEGPFAKFLRAVTKVQKNQENSAVKIRTALVTARNAPAHERVITTLRAWDVRIDETFFLGGLPKTDILKAFGAHIFFDDQKVYSESAASVVPSATVPYLSTSMLFTE